MFIEILSFFLRRSRTPCVCSPTCWPANNRAQGVRGLRRHARRLAWRAIGWAGGMLPLALTVALTRA